MKNKISLKVLLLSSLVIILLNLLVGYMLAEHAFNNVYQFYANDTKTTLTSIIANLDTNAFKEVLATGSRIVLPIQHFTPILIISRIKVI